MSARRSDGALCVHRSCVPLDMDKVRFSPQYQEDYTRPAKPRWQMQATKALPRLDPAVHAGTGKRSPHDLHLNAVDRTGPRRGNAPAPNSRVSERTPSSPSGTMRSCHLPIATSALLRVQNVLAIGLLEFFSTSPTVRDPE